MTIEEIIRKRKITEVMHFTTNRGLLGIFHSGSVKSRARLTADEQLEYIFKPNAAFRKDAAWTDYVNLSISRINNSFYDVSADNWHRNEDLWWCILALSPEILHHKEVVFVTTNNIYTGAQRGKGAKALEALFAPKIVRWNNNVVVRPDKLPQRCTTCVQAEVLYPREIPTDFLRCVYVIKDEDADEVRGQLELTKHRVVDIIVSPNKFRNEVG